MSEIRGILVEGITCAGKSELITALKSELRQFGGFDVKELTHVNCRDQYARYLKEYATQQRVLLHRSHISEHILGAHLRRRSPFSDQELVVLNQIIALQFVCVLVEPNDFETFLERKRKDRRHVRESFSKRKYLEIITSYRECFAEIPHVKYLSSSISQLEATRDSLIAKLTVR